MDITAFVGLAACGPLHTPVPVEDGARFREIFGPDLPLAWDTEAGRMQMAHLGQAVEAFFRNGGRRCWVVRVAEDPETHAFVLPGLVDAANLHPAVAHARCGGSWSDTLHVGTLVSSEALSVEIEQQAAGDYRLIVQGLIDAVPVGTLLRLTFGEDLWLYLEVAAVAAGPSGLRVTAGQGYWFQRRPVYASPPGEATAQAVLLRPGGETAEVPCRVHLPDLDGLYKVRFEPAVSAYTAKDVLAAWTPGTLLPLTVGDRQVLLLIDEAAEELEGSVVQVLGNEAFEPLEEEHGLSAAQATTLSSAERLTFELLIWKGRELQTRLPDLDFSAARPRFWGGLSTDDTLFKNYLRQYLKDARAKPPLPGTLAAEVWDPRFPLAGPATPTASPPASPGGLYLPLGMPVFPDPDLTAGPLGDTSEETRLDRDGVAEFSSTLFLDLGLTDAGSRTLLQQAYHRQYVQRETLVGLHSLLPIEEVTLLAAPDAALPGWHKTKPTLPRPLPAPILDKIDLLADEDAYRLSWTKVAGAEAYRLEESLDPTFEVFVVRNEGSATFFRVTGLPECPQTFYYRVRARKGTEVSPWSGTEIIVAPKDDFEDCGEVLLVAPVVATVAASPPASPPDEAHGICWDEVPGATGYVIEEATDPAFLTATTVYPDSDGLSRTLEGRVLRFTFVPNRRQEGLYYYRVRAVQTSEDDEQTGPWSNTVNLAVTPAEVWTIMPVADYRAEYLLEVQRALLRFCEARADVLAVLSLPAHYRQEQALAHKNALSPDGDSNNGVAEVVRPAGVRPLTMGEAQALRYGALYHPWLHMRLQTGAQETVRLTPPDGAVLGMMAARALARGAWIAPANQVLPGVVALEPVFDRDGWNRLFAAQINLVRQDPRGFLLLSADTLSPEHDLRPISVRRLLILLRRMALREGNSFVFASNDHRLQRRAFHRFDALLGTLYARGAFAGNTPSQAYQVTVDESVNTRQSIDRGRFIVELHVAPARPMAFITVRLVQQGVQGLVLEER